MRNFLDFAISYQIIARSFYRSYQHEMTMREIVRDGRSKAKHLRAAIRYQKKSAAVYASAREALAQHVAFTKTL
jgi:hypothetical protein